MSRPGWGTERCETRALKRAARRSGMALKAYARWASQTPESGRQAAAEGWLRRKGVTP